MKPSATTTIVSHQPRLAVAFITLLSIAPAQADTGNCIGTNVNSWATLMSTYNGAASDLTICLETGSYTAGINERLDTPIGRTLTIDLNGQNVSITTSGYENAAIRVTTGIDSGLIITDSSSAANGILTATGGDGINGGAGIGGDGNDSGGEEGGTITINGGTVNANGGAGNGGGAGIGGGGGYAGSGGNGGSITINGGTLNASGGSSSDGGGAGIGGGGGRYSGGGNGGNVTINGDTVSASGDYTAAGIGGGGGSVGNGGDGGNVTINGGTLNASGGERGAGIGGGYTGNGASISISGGIITATGGSADSFRSGGAAIGSGGSGNSTAAMSGTLDFSGAATDDPAATLPSSYAPPGVAGAAVPTPTSATSTSRFWLFTENSGTPPTATDQSKVKIELINRFTGTTMPNSGVGGQATASFSGGGNTCSFDSGGTAFIAKPAALPAEFDMPQGAFQFTLTGCDMGSTVTMTVTWPQPIGSQYRKWGKAISTATSNSLYTPDNLTTSGNSVTFTVTDGALGDDDWTADGIITDPSGPLASNAPTTGNPAAIPSLGELALALLTLLLTGFGLWQRNSGQQSR